MAVSQNGYPANDVTLTSSRRIPGTERNIRVRNGPAGDLLLWVASQFDKRVEDIDPGIMDDWGYAERPVRGGTVLSNHSSGTAIDLNATRHPLGTEPSANFSALQIREIRAIVGETAHCVRWGGDYIGRKDPMHFEIVASETACAIALGRLSAPVPEVPDVDANENRMLREMATTLLGPNGPVGVFPDPAKGYVTVQEYLRRMDAKLAGLVAAVAALSNDQDLDRDTVESIVRDAVKQNLRITGTLEIDSAQEGQ